MKQAPPSVTPKTSMPKCVVCDKDALIAEGDNWFCSIDHILVFRKKARRRSNV